MKLVVDMNLSPRWVDFLERAGLAAVHWSAVGAPHAPDRDIMAWAAANNRIVLTHDLDFGAVLAATRAGKPSVIQVRTADNSPETIGAALVAALRQSATDLEAGALVTVDVARARIRLLPLER